MTIASPSLVQVVSASSLGLAGECARVRAAQPLGELVAALEVLGGPARARLAEQLLSACMCRDGRQRPVGARVQIGDPLEHGELVAQRLDAHERAA